MALKLSDAYQSSPIKSIQRGSRNGSMYDSVAIAISTVDPSKSMLNISVRTGYAGDNQSTMDSSIGWMSSFGGGGSIRAAGDYIDIEFGSAQSGTTASSATVYWEVIEYV